MKFANRSLVLKDTFFDALKLRGIINIKYNRYKKAIQDLNKALLINKKASDIYFLLGTCYKKKNDINRALKLYYNSEKLGYYNDELFNNIGNILSIKKEYAKALIYFKKAISVNPNKPIYYYNKGIALYTLGHKQSAINSWKEA